MTSFHRAIPSFYYDLDITDIEFNSLRVSCLFYFSFANALLILFTNPCKIVSAFVEEYILRLYNLLMRVCSLIGNDHFQRLKICTEHKTNEFIGYRQSTFTFLYTLSTAIACIAFIFNIFLITTEWNICPHIFVHNLSLCLRLKRTGIN